MVFSVHYRKESLKVQKGEHNRYPTCRTFQSKTHYCRNVQHLLPQYFFWAVLKRIQFFAIGRNLWQLLPPHSLHKILISVKTKARVSRNHFGCYNPGLENATITIFTFTITIFRSAMISWNTFLCCESCNHFGHILHFWS